MDLNTLVLLAAVVDAGSLSQAAKDTGIPKSTISRRLKALEEELGVRLLQRTSRQLGLTQAGALLVERARGIQSVVDELRDDIRAQNRAPSGPLRVAMSVSFAERVVAPILVEFMRAYPKVQLELVLDAARNDLIQERIDVAIRIGAPEPSSSLVARRLATTRARLCAAPSYLEARGRPEELAELRDHEGLIYRPDGRAVWTLADESGEMYRVEPRVRLAANSHVIVAKAAVAGLGIALLPQLYFAQAQIDAGELVAVLSEYTSPELWVVAAFPDRALASAARTFVDFLAERFDPNVL